MSPPTPPSNRGSSLPPAHRQAVTVVVPAAQRDAERIRELEEPGPVHTVASWPHDPPSQEDTYPDRPTPPVVVVPVRPEPTTGTLTKLRGVDAGKRFRLISSRTVIGRGLGADIALDEDTISRRHALVLRQDAGQFAIEDLGSTNGTYVQGLRVDRALLVAGDRVQLGSTVLLRFALLPDDEESLERRLFESSTRDQLTGLLNRRTLEQRLELASEESRRTGRPFAILMIDLDHFKHINDTHGHPVGDEVLRAIAKQLVRALRARDLVARYGGEEFTVIAGSTSAAQARALAERVRSAIEEVTVRADGALVSTTACVGVASSAEGVTHSAHELLARADRRLYDAKQVGPNRVWAG